MRKRHSAEQVAQALRQAEAGTPVARVPADRPPTPDEAARARVAYENEIVAKLVVLNLRTLVMLEELHDDSVNFSADRSFQPLPPEWRRTNDMDDAAFSTDADDVESDSETA